MKTKKRQLHGPSDFDGNAALLKLYRACLENAEQLCEEAELLFEAHFNARAYALAYTAIEEVAKAHAVADLFTGVLSYSEFTDAFRDHKMKAAYLRRTVALPSVPFSEATVEYDRRSVESVITSRNSALYVDFGADLAAVTPREAFDAESAESAIEQARALLHEILVNDEYFGHQIGTKGLWK